MTNIMFFNVGLGQKERGLQGKFERKFNTVRLNSAGFSAGKACFAFSMMTSSALDISRV